MKTYQATVQKESQATQFGLMLSQKTGSSQILIKNIASNGAFGGTELVPGLQVMEINRQGLSDKTVQDAVRVLKEAPIGEICVVARGVVATVRKETKDSKVGISIQKKICDNGGPAEMIVKNISQDGLFANSGLQAGQRITAINGLDCPEKSSVAIEIIREAVGELTIVAVESKINNPPPEQAPLQTPTLNHFLEDYESSPRDSGILSTTVLDGCKPDEKEESSRTPPLGLSLENYKASSNGSEIDSTKPLPDLKPETEEEEEEEYTIEANSPEASERMLNTPVLAEGVVIDSEYGSNGFTSEKPYEVTAIISKSYPGEKVGLGLRNSKGIKQVIVNEVIKGGLADKSKVRLRVGQTVLSINGQDCPPSAKRATELITEAPRTVTVVATNTVATAYKADANTKIGIALKSSHMNDDVLIESVSPTGLFANSNLKEGQIVASINGQECPDTAHSAIQIVKSCVGRLTIVVGDRAIQPKLQAELKTAVQESRSPCVPKAAAVAQQNGGGTRSVITNKEMGKWIGVSFGMSQGSIIVCKIADESLFAGSELKVGQKIVYVNGDECPETIPDLISRIYKTSGTLTLVSAEIRQDEPTFAPVREPQKPTPSVLPPGQVRAHITNKRRDQPVGLKVVRSFQDRIVISTIRKDGLLGNSDLCIGQYIVSINGTPCPSTKGETAKLIKDAVGPLAIVASLSIGTAEKSKASTSVGISLGKQKDGDDIVIMKLSGNSPLHGGQQSDLREGQRVISINGYPCPTAVHDAISTIKKCVGKLTIEAVDRFKVKLIDDATAVRAVKESAPLLTDGPSEEDSQGFKEILATVSDKKSSDMLALSIGVTQNYAFVNHIAADSPFIATDLCVGHRIAKIDGEMCPLPLQDAMELFAQHVGTITIDALEKVVSIGQVSASMVKKSKHTPAALQVAKSAQGRIVISEIDENGPFACSVLRVGQVLESVNGRPCHDNDSMNQYFGAATGKVTIIASPTVATAFKENIDQKAGILLRRIGEASEILVQEVKKDGLFGRSDLRKGQKIVSIAGVQCPKDLREAIGLIQDCVGELKIVALDTLPKQHTVPLEARRERAETYVGQITVSSTKETRQSRIGMKLRKGMQQGKVVISLIKEDGPMAGTGLKVGMCIVSINNEPCPRDPKLASERIKGLEGNVTIVASPTVATVRKKSKKTKVGLSLAKTKSSTVFVHHIAQGGLFENTDLQVGQSIIAIDGKNCEWSLQEAIKSIEDCVGELNIVALDNIIMNKS
jgi:C-terminal processing protease CtpA/Prc